MDVILMKLREINLSQNDADCQTESSVTHRISNGVINKYKRFNPWLIQGNLNN